MSETKLFTARAYIESGDYQAAKAILETMPDNPTAQRWLAKLPKIAPRSFIETQSQAQQSEKPKKSSRQRWEYCVAGPFMFLTQGGVMPHYPVIITYSTNGQDLNPIRVGNTKEGNAITSLIAEMGLEGWELVAAGNVMLSPSQMGHMLYFKRLLIDDE